MKNKIEGLTIPKIKGVPIAMARIVNRIVTMDSKMNWVPKILFWIYAIVVRPTLLYAFFLWNHICNYKYVQNKLDVD